MWRAFPDTVIDATTERRRYHPEEATIPLSAAVREAVEAHDNTSLRDDEFDLYDHVSPDTIDALFRDADRLDVIVQFRLTNVTVSVWSDDAVDIRVTDEVEGR